MSTAIWKQNDLEPPAQAPLLNADGSPIDLTTATSVKFLMRPTGTSGSPKVTHAVTITDAANGIVKYAWVSGDTDTVGTFDQEWEITWPTSRPQTVPNHGYNTVVIEDDLG